MSAAAEAGRGGEFWRPATGIPSPGGSRSAEPRASDRLTGGWPAHRPPPGGRRHRLFLGSEDGGDAAAAFLEERSDGAFSPAGAPEDLALDLPGSGAPPENAARLLFPEFHRAFPRREPAAPGRPAPPPPTIANPAYLLAALTRAAGGRADLLFAAREDEVVARAPDLLAGRGGASSLEVVRGNAPPAAPASAPGADDAKAADGPRTPAESRRLALHAPNPADRARAADAAVEADPDDPVARLLLGCSLSERKDPAGAAAAFRLAAERAPDLAAAHFELGKTLIQLDDLEGALAAFRRTTGTLPEFASGWANAGAALGELERPAEALADLERAAELDPLHHAPSSNLGVTLRDLGRLEEAEAAFRRALELAPDFVFGRYNLAGVVYLRGRHREAVTLFEEARAEDPSGSARQRLLLAAARLASGDEAGALAEYEGTFASLDGRMREDMRTVAEWDLKNLARRVGVSPGLRRAADLLKRVRA